MRFECKSCGDCCRNFGEKDKCIPLFSWEVKELEKLAKENCIKIEFKPIKYLLDKNSNFVFIYLYGIANKICPFLNKDKCSIYHERPLICRQFPLFWTASTNLKEEFGASCFSECSHFNCKDCFDKYFLGSEEVKNKEIDSYLQEIYEECFNHALLSNKLGLKILEIIKKHDLSKELGLVNIQQQDLNKYSQVSFCEFLKIKGFYQDLKGIEDLYSQKIAQH